MNFDPKTESSPKVNACITFHEPAPGYVRNIHDGDAEAGTGSGSAPKMTEADLKSMEAAGNHF